MMHNCESCGLQAIPGARFCRQCGAPLFIETDETMAQTRHYRGRVAVPPAPGYQTTMPPGDDTARFNYPQTAPSRYTVPQPQGSSSSFWLVMALLGVLVVSGLAGAIATNIRINGRRPRPVSA